MSSNRHATTVRWTRPVSSSSSFWRQHFPQPSQSDSHSAFDMSASALVFQKLTCSLLVASLFARLGGGDDGLGHGARARRVVAELHGVLAAARGGRAQVA